jgi:hypothetical protein
MASDLFPPHFFYHRAISPWLHDLVCQILLSYMQQGWLGSAETDLTVPIGPTYGPVTHAGN